MLRVNNFVFPVADLATEFLNMFLYWCKLQFLIVILIKLTLQLV